jgi:CheY-like chemotaxis protein
VGKILKFSRSEPSAAPQQLDLYDVTSNALSLLRSTLPSTIQCTLEGAPGCNCLGIPDDVEQMVVNLCTNAAQAIGQRPGRITLVIDRYQAKEPEPGLLVPGRYCRLRVVDDGPGMDPEVLDHIFEPFFTTKPAGQGTGLGLSMAHRLMTEMGGAISCSSLPGQGAEFTLYFPESLELRPAVAARAHPAPPLGHGERVLLVDDEQVLANLAGAFLTQAGYHVTKFYDPNSALSAFRAHPDDYDLVMTDLAMPGMTGIELVGAMRALRPELPVVLCTGFGGDPDSAIQKHCNVVLPKPCGRVELYNAVRQALRTFGSAAAAVGVVGVALAELALNGGIA